MYLRSSVFVLDFITTRIMDVLAPYVVGYLPNLSIPLSAPLFYTNQLIIPDNKSTNKY